MTAPRLVDAHKRDLGGFTVRRVLPAEGRQMVGPFIFFDHLGRRHSPRASESTCGRIRTLRSPP